jgi:hypothetical protein
VRLYPLNHVKQFEGDVLASTVSNRPFSGRKTKEINTVPQLAALLARCTRRHRFIFVAHDFLVLVGDRQHRKRGRTLRREWRRLGTKMLQASVRGELEHERIGSLGCLGLANCSPTVVRAVIVARECGAGYG